MSASASWSDERVTTLSKLWCDGLSASQIAKALGGVTRNAVIGKVHRLGLSGRALPSVPRRPQRTAPARAVSRTRRPSPGPTAPTPRPPRAAASSPAAFEGPGLVRDLARLPAHACKWPIGDPKSPDFSFCGHQADGRYCRAHEDVGVRRGTAWRADRDPVVRRALAGLI